MGNDSVSIFLPVVKTQAATSPIYPKLHYEKQVFIAAVLDCSMKS